jgi:hypothetical protein
MKRYVSFALAFSLMGGPIRSMSFNARPISEICEVCGHKCCCPERCQKIIEEHRQASCDHPAHLCNLQAPAGSSEARQQEGDLRSDLRLCALDLFLDIGDGNVVRLNQDHQIYSGSPYLDVLTPPPRFLVSLTSTSF